MTATPFPIPIERISPEIADAVYKNEDADVQVDFRVWAAADDVCVLAAVDGKTIFCWEADGGSAAENVAAAIPVIIQMIESPCGTALEAEDLNHIGEVIIHNFGTLDNWNARPRKDRDDFLAELWKAHEDEEYDVIGSVRDGVDVRIRVLDDLGYAPGVLPPPAAAALIHLFADRDGDRITS